MSEFFPDHTTPPTKGAFSQSRAGLCHKVFKRLNLLVCRLFYSQCDHKKWKGFRVLSVDGSTLALPDHGSLERKFSRHCFGAKKSVQKWMSTVSYLYDVLNNVVMDAQMESFSTSEATLCDMHLGFMRKGDLVLFDRYYASHYLFSVLSHKKVEFVFRMRQHSWTCVKEFAASNLKEQIVELDVYPYSKVAKKIPSNINRKVGVRLVKQTGRCGEITVYATSLLDGSRYSRKSIMDLYRKRWGVEESFKTLKARLNIVHFSGKTLQAVQQDFYAKMFLISLTSVLQSDISPALKTKKQSQNKESRIPKLNNSYAMSQTKKLLKRLFDCFEKLSDWLFLYIKRIKSAVEYSRKGQSLPRKMRKGENRPYNQNYKPI